MTYTHWDSCLDSGRNELLFENRNKSFGAYVIRREYPRSIILSFLSTILTAGILVAIAYFAVHPIATIPGNGKTDEAITLTEVVIPPIDIPAVVEPPKSAAQPSTQELVNPVVVARVPVETILPAPTGSSINSGAVTTPGDPAPVVATGNPGNVIPDVIPDNKPLKWVEKMPKFPGGEEALIQFLITRINYPPEAKKKNIEGTVYLSFVIDEAGKVTDVKLLHGIFSQCDAEAIRAVNSMPDWSPGIQNGKNVSVEMSLPVNFRLK